MEFSVQLRSLPKRDKKIDVILSENKSALPCQLSMGFAIKNAGLPIVTHDLDFH